MLLGIETHISPYVRNRTDGKRIFGGCVGALCRLDLTPEPATFLPKRGSPSEI
jgi:hypothetical protein